MGLFIGALNHGTGEQNARFQGPNGTATSNRQRFKAASAPSKDADKRIKQKCHAEERIKQRVSTQRSEPGTTPISAPVADPQTQNVSTIPFSSSSSPIVNFGFSVT